MEPLFLTNAHIYTMDPGRPNASALVIQNGKITAVLDGPEAEDPPAGVKIQDLEGRIILPGLIDAHLHLRQYAESLQKIDCETPTREQCLKKVAKRVQKTKPGQWILGHGWNHNQWKSGYGFAEELDRITTDHPIYLTGKSLHVSWANTLALEKAGIVTGSPDPPGGSIQRDESGRPTGIIFEKAVKQIEDVIPKPSVEETARNILTAQETLRSMGITGVHDFDRELCIQALQLLDQNDQLRIRVLKSIPKEFLDQAIEFGYRTGEGSNWLWFGGVKLFTDGALGPMTAAMLQPYEGSDELGMLLLSEEELYEIGTKAAKARLSLSVHAIGDLANRTILDAYQRLRKFELAEGIQPLPHRIEHVQLIDPADVSRLAEVNITASMQPIHATSDMEMAEKYWGKRTAYAYAPIHQFKAGALVAFGSDAPVESPNPWWGIHAAVTRRRGDGSPGPEGWHPEGKVTLEQALEGFTTNPALAAGRGDIQGKIAPGYWADLIILDADPFTLFPDELMEVKPYQTIVNGNIN
jgi:predicted amidohydrolase YtcJ